MPLSRNIPSELIAISVIAIIAASCGPTQPEHSVTGTTTFGRPSTQKTATAVQPETERSPVTGSPQAKVTPDEPGAPARPELRPVKEGTLPLVYLIEVASPVRIVNLTTRTRLAEGRLPRRTIVRIDARGGVHFGKELIVSGPLSADHQYGIFIDPAEPDSSAQTTTEKRNNSE